MTDEVVMKLPFLRARRPQTVEHGPEKIREMAAEFFQFEKNAMALEQAKRDLLGQYPDSWVAFRSGKLAIVEKDESAFFKRYQSELSGDPTVAIAFLSSDPIHFVPTLAQ